MDLESSQDMFQKRKSFFLKNMSEPKTVAFILFKGKTLSWLPLFKLFVILETDLNFGEEIFVGRSSLRERQKDV